MILNRNNDALPYFKLAHSILDLELGRFSERTLIVEQNIMKCRKAFIQSPPAFQTMWKTYVEKPGLKKDGNAQKGKKVK